MLPKSNQPPQLGLCEQIKLIKEANVITENQARLAAKAVVKNTATTPVSDQNTCQYNKEDLTLTDRIKANFRSRIKIPEPLTKSE